LFSKSNQQSLLQSTIQALYYHLLSLYVVGNSFALGMWRWKCANCEVFVRERVGPNC